MSGNDDDTNETKNLSKTDVKGIANAAAERAANAAVEKALQAYSSRASQLNPLPHFPPDLTIIFT